MGIDQSQPECGEGVHDVDPYPHSQHLGARPQSGQRGLDEVTGPEDASYGATLGVHMQPMEGFEDSVGPEEQGGSPASTECFDGP